MAGKLNEIFASGQRSELQRAYRGFSSAGLFHVILRPKAEGSLKTLPRHQPLQVSFLTTASIFTRVNYVGII